MRVDRKYNIKAVNVSSGKEFTHDEVFILKASDDAVLETLRFYLEESLRQGAKSEQLDCADNLFKRVKLWREDNPDKCKVADVTPDEAKLILEGE